MTLLLVTDIMLPNSSRLEITLRILVYRTDNGPWGVLGGLFSITGDRFRGGLGSGTTATIACWTKLKLAVVIKIARDLGG